MTQKLILAVLLAICMAAAASAAEPGAALIPSTVQALKGCWHGTGEVLGKKVSTTLAAKGIVQNAMFLVEVESYAVANHHDHYSAHLLFGGGKPNQYSAEPMVAYWADSFGGTYTSTGHGVSRPYGFDVTYKEGKDVYVNRWRLQQDRLTWTITARDRNGKELPFAGYSLKRAMCQPIDE